MILISVTPSNLIFYMSKPRKLFLMEPIQYLLRQPFSLLLFRSRSSLVTTRKTNINLACWPSKYISYYNMLCPKSLCNVITSFTFTWLLKSFINLVCVLSVFNLCAQSKSIYFYWFLLMFNAYSMNFIDFQCIFNDSQ